MRDWFRVTRLDKATEEEKAKFEEDLLATEPPSGEGWVIELKGFHYFNDIIGSEGGNHVRKYLTEAFLNGSVEIPLRDSLNNVAPDVFNTQEMGISFPLLLSVPGMVDVQIPNPEYEAPLGGTPGMASDSFGGTSGPVDAFGNAIKEDDANEDDEGKPKQPPYFEAKRFDVTFQFVWKPKTRSVRLEERAERLKLAKEEAEAAAAEAAQQADQLDPGAA